MSIFWAICGSTFRIISLSLDFRRPQTICLFIIDTRVIEEREIHNFITILVLVSRLKKSHESDPLSEKNTIVRKVIFLIGVQLMQSTRIDFLA